MDIPLTLKKIPRDGRSIEQVLNHYQVEATIAKRLKNATREERPAIYSSMYEELFDKVPDHPRLNIRDSAKLSKRFSFRKLNLLKPYLNEKTVFVEFAPGDCRFAILAARKAKQVFGVDISKQYHQEETFPTNFNLIIYDGYSLEGISPGTVDLVFSDQLVEHIHPEDVEHHFALVKNMLRKGGAYIMRTPHKSSGPHDVSAYFSEVPLGFHLKEWDYAEIEALANQLNFKLIKTYWFAKGYKIRLPKSYFLLMEKIFSILPFKVRHNLSQIFIPSVCCVFRT